MFWDMENIPSLKSKDSGIKGCYLQQGLISQIFDQAQPG